MSLDQAMFPVQRDMRLQGALDDLNRAKGFFYDAMVATGGWAPDGRVASLTKNRDRWQWEHRRLTTELHHLEKTMLKKTMLLGKWKDLRRAKASFYDHMVLGNRWPEDPAVGLLRFLPHALANKLEEAKVQVFDGIPRLKAVNLDPRTRSLFEGIVEKEAQLGKEMAKGGGITLEDLDFYSRRADWALQSALEKEVAQARVSLVSSLFALERAKVEVYEARIGGTTFVDGARGEVAQALEDLRRAHRLLRDSGLSPWPESPSPLTFYLEQ